MKNIPVSPLPAAGRIPKAEAIEKITRSIAAVRVLLAAARIALAAGVSPEKYRLNFKLNALKKQVRSGKAQIARLKREPRADVLWSDKLGA
jgi:hypothetical protein